MILKKKLGEILLESKLLTEEQLEQVLAESKKVGFRLGQYITSQGLLNENQIIDVLSRQLKIEKYYPDKYPLDMNLASLFPIDIAKKFQVAPLRQNCRLLTIAMTDPQDINALDNIEATTNCEVDPVFCTEKEIFQLINDLYGIQSYPENNLLQKNPDHIIEAQDIIKNTDKETYQTSGLEFEKLISSCGKPTLFQSIKAFFQSIKAQHQVIKAKNPSNRRQHEEQSIFKGTIDRIRASFLREAFDLSDSDLEMLHFDGKHFHFQDGLKHFSEFSSISCYDPQKVTIINPDLPHVNEWRHSCVDGSPDLRYKYNPATMYSLKHTFQFRGQTPQNLVAYSTPWKFLKVPYKSEDGLLYKINRFLSVSSKRDLESIIEEYKSATNNLKTLESSYISLEKNKAELEEALKASMRLATAADIDTVRTHQEISKKLMQYDLDAKQLEMKMSPVYSELSKIIQKVKDLDALEKDLSILEKYRKIT